MIDEFKLKKLLPREIIVPDSSYALLNILNHEIENRSGVYAIFRNGVCIAYSSAKNNLKETLIKNIYKYFKPDKYTIIRFIYLNKPDKIDELYNYFKYNHLYDSLYLCFKFDTKTLLNK